MLKISGILFFTSAPDQPSGSYFPMIFSFLKLDILEPNTQKLEVQQNSKTERLVNDRQGELYGSG